MTEQDQFYRMARKVGYTIIYVILFMLGFEFAKVYDLILNHVLFLLYNYVLGRVDYMLINYLLDIPLFFLELGYFIFISYKFFIKEILRN